jgi:hypothetical protein
VVCKGPVSFQAAMGVKRVAATDGKRARRQG